MNLAEYLGNLLFIPFGSNTGHPVHRAVEIDRGFWYYDAVTSEILKMRPRILLVDDHEIVRKGIRQLLEGPTRDVCGEATNGEDAIKKVSELKPDLVVMDYLMPGMSGAEVIHKIREMAPSTKIVILTMDDAIAAEAKTIGADACVHKGSVVSDLQKTINRVLLGHELPEGW